MPEVDVEGHNYHVDKPAKSELFYLKGSNELGWGMKNRLARVLVLKMAKLSCLL